MKPPFRTHPLMLLPTDQTWQINFGFLPTPKFAKAYYKPCSQPANHPASLPTIQPSECLSVCLASTLVDTRQLMIVEYSREGYLRLTKQQQLLCIGNRNRSNQIRNRTKSPEEDTDRKFVRTVICNMIKTSRDYDGCLWERREQRVVSESSKGRTKPKI